MPLIVAQFVGDPVEVFEQSDRHAAGEVPSHGRAGTTFSAKSGPQRLSAERPAVHSDVAAFTGPLAGMQSLAHRAAYDTPGTRQHAATVARINDLAAMGSPLMAALDRRLAAARSAGYQPPEEVTTAFATVAGLPDTIDDAGTSSARFAPLRATLRQLRQGDITPANLHWVSTITLLLDTVLLLGRLETLRRHISLGPVATFFDDDVHEWTSRLDVELSDGQTLCTVAVGNNGALQNELGRIQPPGDAVNSFAIGAADSPEGRWQKAPYSAFGPGRSPGFVKPDAVAFGGSIAHPFQIYSPMVQQQIGLAGTSYASPLALRAAAGVDALSKGIFRPVTLQALLINSCEFNARHKHKRPDVGWGRIRHVPEDIIETAPDVVRVVYQGVTRPGMPQIARIPIPKGLPSDLNIKIGATFVYRAPVDPAHAANYTRAGLWVRCYAAKGRSLSLFGSGMYRSEADLRKDGQRWDTVLSAVRSVEAGKLDDPYFHINYQVRDEGEAVASKDADPLPYALIVTIEAPGTTDLLARIQQQFPVLQTLQLATPIQTTT